MRRVTGRIDAAAALFTKTMADLRGVINPPPSLQRAAIINGLNTELLETKLNRSVKRAKRERNAAYIK